MAPNRVAGTSTGPSRGGFAILKKIVLILAFLSPFIFFSSKIIPWKSDATVVNLPQDAVFPVESLWSSSLSGLKDVWRIYFSLSDAARENIALKEQVSAMKVQVLDYDEKTQEIGRLRKLLGFTATLPKEHIVTEVVSAPTNRPFQTLRVAAGAKDGVKVGMPVVSEQGVVGKVVRLGIRHSDVQLVVDSNFHLDILLQRTRVRGVTKGYLSSLCQLKLSRKAEVRIGDTVITSGIVGAFPKGLPLGKVVRINYENENISQTVTIEPWVNYKQLEEVVIIKTDDREVSQISSAVGEEWLERAVAPDKDKG